MNNEEISREIEKIKYVITYNPPKTFFELMHRLARNFVKLFIGTMVCMCFLFMLALMVGLSDKVEPHGEVEMDEFTQSMSILVDLTLIAFFVTGFFILLCPILSYNKFNKFSKELTRE